MEEDGSDVGNHYRTERVRQTAASSGHYEHRAVNELPAQLGDPCLPLLLALFFGGAELGATVSRGRRRGVGGRLDPERPHQQRGRLVTGAHLSWPAWRRAIEQEAIRGTGRVRKRAHEAFAAFRGGQLIERIRDRAGLRLRGQHGLSVRGEAFVDVQGALALDLVRKARVTSLAEGQRLANGQRA
jgi:hypothetical protein